MRSTLTRALMTAAALTLPAAALGATAPAHAVANPTLLLPNVTVTEGDSGQATFIVNVGLSAPNPLSHAVTVDAVDFSAVPIPGGVGTYGTATAGSDYVAFGTRTLTFQPGQQVARLKIVLKGDRTVEGNEEIDVRFANTELTVGDNDIDLVIGNDDATTDTKKPLLLLPNQTMPEPDAGCFAYQVSTMLDRPATAASTVNAVDFTTVPLPAPLVGTYGTATPGSDYTAFGVTTLHFARGARVANLPVTICGDTAAEGSEEIDVRFDNTTTLAVADNDIDLILSDND
jgi:hypothetical protein